MVGDEILNKYFHILKNNGSLPVYNTNVKFSRNRITGDYLVFGNQKLMEIKLCKTCHYVDHDNKKCFHEAVGMWVIDYYDGAKTWASPSIQTARIIGDCGEDGKLWEPIN